MPVRESLIGTFAALQKWRAIHANALPGGWLGYAEVIAPQGPITTETALTGLSVTVDVPANRLLKISAYVTSRSDTVDDRGSVLINEGADRLQNLPVSYRVANVSYHHSGFVLVTPTAGSHTYSLALARGFGSGELASRSDPDEPSYILVEDLGAAPS